MSSQRDPLLFFENRLNLLIIDILEPAIEFCHDSFDSPIVPGGQITMKLIILAQHLYLFGVLLLLIFSLEILLLVIIIIIVLKLDVCGWDGLIEYFIDFFAVIEVLRWWVLAVQWVRHQGCILFHIFRT